MFGVLVGFLFGELEHDGGVFQPAPQAFKTLQLGVLLRQRRRDTLRVVLVVPQIRGCCLLLERRDLVFQLRNIGDRLDRLQRVIELLNTHFEILVSHNGSF